jgi:hypothetical protein
LSALKNCLAALKGYQMKRLVTLFCLLASISPCFADVPVPEWSEFVPTEYLNPQSGPVHPQMSKKKKALIISSGLLNPFVPTAIFAGRKMREKNEVDLRDYWTRRKTQFDNEVATCDATTTDKAMCYMQLRQMESNKNQSFSQLQMQAQQTAATRSLAASQSYRPVQVQAQPTHATCNTMGTMTNCNSY